MSRNCKYFVQHAWKQDLCANCFESREDHRRKLKQLNIFVPDFGGNIKSILRSNENNQKQRRNVMFRTSLTEIIGYGGDDLYDNIEYNTDNVLENEITDINNVDDCDDEGNTESIKKIGISKLDTLNSDEEERALNNLTQSNTNFNRFTANLSDSSFSSMSLNDTEKITPKLFNNLMLGNTQKDSTGKKKTLLVSVTPFGTSNNSGVITAEKSTDKTIINDEKKRVIAAESNYSSSSVSNKQSMKSHQTIEISCQNTNESIITTNTMESNHKEEMGKKLSYNEIKNDSIIIEDVVQSDSTKNSLEKSININIEHIAMEDEVTHIESMNCESLSTDNQKSNRIDDIKLNDEKIFEDSSSNSSSIECSTINSLPELSTILPKPRNSFLHGGRNINDIENPSSISDDENRIMKSSLTSNATKNNLSNIESTEEQVVSYSSEKCSDDPSSSIFTRKPVSTVKSDCPVVREKEKRERATSCSPKFRKMDESSLNRNYNNDIPVPMTKQIVTRSLSRQSSSSYSEVFSNTNCVDDEMKKKNKTRFSLKRLLRIGSSKKDLNITTTNSLVESINNMPSIPHFKSKPEIIHPLELDGAAVEILCHDKLMNITDEITNFKTPNVKAVMREPPPPPPTNKCSSMKPDCHQLSTIKFTRHLLNDENERTKLPMPDVDREHPSCHSISNTSTSPVHSITTDPIHTGIHNFGKFRPIQCN